jgi:hypothetical protein
MKFPMTASLYVAMSVVLTAWHATGAAALRDPTEPPPAAQAAMAASGAGSVSAAEAGDAPMPRHIVVSNGRSYLIERGRRLGVGDALGHARIERIESDAVWLREGSSTRRVPLYAGVTKRPAIENSPASSAAAAAPTAKRTARTYSPQKEAP